MTLRAATRCWGLAFVLGTAVPVASQSAPSASPKTPAAPAFEHAWTAPLGDADPSDLLVIGATVLVSTGDGLAAFDVETGKSTWRIDLESGAMLASSDGTVIVSTAGRLDAIDPADGRRRWTTSPPTGEVTALVVTRETVIVAGGLEVRVYSSGDGTPMWQETFATAPASLATDNGKLFVGLVNHHLISFDLAKRTRISDVEIDAGPVEIVAGHDRLLVSGADGALYLYRQNRDISFVWRIQRVEPVGRPVIDERMVYVAQFDNTARAYSLGNGTERWRLRLDARPLPGAQIAAGNVFFPLLTGAVASAAVRTRNGQPSGIIPVPGGSDDAPSARYRLEAGALTSDGRLLFRVIGPASHSDWQLLASKLK